MAELKLMEESASVTCEVLPDLLYCYSFHQPISFNPVVCGGSNASVIHSDRNDQKMGIVENEYLVLEDVGCELRGYVSDRTRIWPSYGSFSSAQEELYDLIQQTNKISVELCEPGANIREMHNFSVEMLHKGLKEIGILKDFRSNSYHQMNPTSIGFSVPSLTKISVFCFSNIIRHQSDYVLHLSTFDLAYQDVTIYEPMSTIVLRLVTTVL
ncbi:unnamed protein product [Malus baccata var. baccata]